MSSSGMTVPVAHAGHWITTVAYFLPVVAFLGWLVVTQIRERRGDARRDAGEADE
jgi:hypothetical protein